MDSSEINYSNRERAGTRLGQGPEGWFLAFDNGDGDKRLLAEGDIERIVAAHSHLLALTAAGQGS